MNRYINAEQIKSELQGCINLFDGRATDFTAMCKALALTTSQEQRIAELTEEVAVKVVTLIELDKQINRLTEENERLKARTVDALTEFAENVKRYYSALPGATVGATVRFYVDEKLKEALDKI